MTRFQYTNLAWWYSPSMSKLFSSTILIRSANLFICSAQNITYHNTNLQTTFSSIDASDNISPRLIFSIHTLASDPNPNFLCFLGRLGGVNKAVGSAVVRIMMASWGISAGARLFEAKGCQAISNSSLVVQWVRKCFFKFPFRRHVFPQSGLNWTKIT